MNPAIESALRVVAALDDAGIAYALMGGIATQLHSVTATTFDVDLTIVSGEVDRALQTLSAAGFEIPEAYRKGYQDSLRGMKKVSVLDVHVSPPIEVDMFIVTTPFQQASFARTRRLNIGARTVSVFSAEDIILYKLMAWRFKDRGAIQSILITNPSIDRAYLSEWARRLDVTRQLEESLAETDAFWKPPEP